MNFDSIFLFNLTAISAYFQPVDIDISLKNFTTFLNDYIFMVKEFGETISVQFTSPIKFTELQTVLLTVFLVIFSVNLALIGFYWNKYGGVITDRFIRQSTLKEIEELKLSVAKLKLPHEHTPRI